MLIIGGIILFFLLLFIICSIKVAHDADEVIENVENISNL